MAKRENDPMIRPQVGPIISSIAVLVVGLVDSALADPALDAQWPAYGRDAGGSRYSEARQITRDNVAQLEIAWRYQTGHLAGVDTRRVRTAFEATPILAAGGLVFCTPFNQVIALDPTSGRERWRFDPEVDRGRRPANQYTCRGLSQWREAAAAEAACAHRLFMGTVDLRLIALDARTGKPCADFGQAGTVAVDPEMDLRWPGEFQITSPPAVAGDVVIVGSSVGDNLRALAPRGTVRAYHARTGNPRWRFEPISADPASWQDGSAKRTGHANVWSTISVDPARGLVFLPTSSPSPDFFGGARPGDNRYANSVVALKALTGDVVWHFQTVHHDVWDYDLAAQPTLMEVVRDGQRIPAVLQATKTGFLFLLHRETGAPVLPVEERPMPGGGVLGERLSPTQPVPVAPPPLVPQRLTPDDAWGPLWFDRRACRKAIAALRNDGLFTPPSLQGSILFPFTGGGANWGGAAIDPARAIAVVNTSRAIHVVTLIPRDDFAAAKAAEPDKEISPQEGTAFGVKREILLSPLGLPCNPPTWGALAAVDMNTGEILWESVLGTPEDVTPIPVTFAWGTPNFGGPIVTAGGLVFIGAAMDDYLRAFDLETGQELWKGRLPAGGQATPMTYQIDGRQFVVIAAGGHSRLGTTLGDYVVAFALPEN